MTDEQRKIMNELAELGFEAYSNFKEDPKFIDYLEDVSVLQYYGKTNIGSRPSKRKSAAKLSLSDLRAIPFVGAWTQMKQNVPGFYGVGAALKKYEDEGNLDKVKDFYKKSYSSERLSTILCNPFAKRISHLLPILKKTRNLVSSGEDLQ